MNEHKYLLPRTDSLIGKHPIDVLRAFGYAFANMDPIDIKRFVRNWSKKYHSDLRGEGSRLTQQILNTTKTLLEDDPKTQKRLGDEFSYIDPRYSSRSNNTPSTNTNSPRPETESKDEAYFNAVNTMTSILKTNNIKAVMGYLDFYSKRFIDNNEIKQQLNQDSKLLLAFKTFIDTINFTLEDSRFLLTKLLQLGLIKAHQMLYDKMNTPNELEGIPGFCLDWIADALDENDFRLLLENLLIIQVRFPRHPKDKIDNSVDIHLKFDTFLGNRDLSQSEQYELLLQLTRMGLTKIKRSVESFYFTKGCLSLLEGKGYIYLASKIEMCGSIAFLRLKSFGEKIHRIFETRNTLSIGERLRFHNVLVQLQRNGVFGFFCRDFEIDSLQKKLFEELNL